MATDRTQPGTNRPRLEFPTTPINAREHGLFKDDYKQAASDAYNRATRVLLRPIPNLDKYEGVKVTLDVEGDNPWALRFWNDELRITTIRPGTQHVRSREISFRPKDKDGQHVYYFKEGKIKRQGVSGSNMPWILERAQQDLDSVLAPAEQADQETRPLAIPADLDAQLLQMIQIAQATFLRNIPNFYSARVGLIDSDKNRWKLIFREGFLLAEKFYRTGPDLGYIRVSDNQGKLDFTYTIREYRKSQDYKTTPEQQKKPAIETLRRLFAPAAQAGPLATY